MLAPRHKAALEWIEANTDREATVYADPNGLAYWAGAISHREWIGRWSAPYPAIRAEWDATGCILGLLDCPGPPENLFDYYIVEYEPDVPWLRLVHTNEGVNVYEMVR